MQYRPALPGVFPCAAAASGPPSPAFVIPEPDICSAWPWPAYNESAVLPVRGCLRLSPGLAKHMTTTAPSPCRSGFPLLLGKLCLALGLLAGSAVQAEPREVRVGVYANAPKILLDEQGEPSGILGDLLKEIAQREGWTLKAVSCAWQECLAALSAGQIDLMPDIAF